VKPVAKREAAVAALRELILAGEQYRLAVAHRLGLTVSESQAISYLMARGPMGQTELGAALGFNTSSTTALVDRLERNAVAVRVPHPTDRRRSIVHLTPSADQGLAEVQSWMSSAFEKIRSADLPALTADLLVLAESLHARATEVLAAEPHTPPNRAARHN
jgi:DNA-binding MarR family transcriptional regulator